MNTEEFIKSRPYLYHLTDPKNSDYLKTNGMVLLSTNELICRSTISSCEAETIIKNRRANHTEITINGHVVHIRDQRPVSLKNLNKCLTNGWSCSDFLLFLNMRVFFWPTIDRLVRHFIRYVDEGPCILRVPTQDLFQLNPYPLFSNLNTGATRSSSFYNGAPPPRGPSTFLPAEKYESSIRSVAEVTFIRQCKLPDSTQVSFRPTGPWDSF